MTLTRQEAADRLKICYHTFFRWETRLNLQPVEIKGCVLLFSISQVEQVREAMGRRRQRGPVTKVLSLAEVRRRARR